jgi:hypothetical protein
MDPRNRTGPSGDFRAVDGVTVRDLQPNVPVQGTLRSVRRDAWTLYPNDVIGRVWIILKKPLAGTALPVDDPTALEVFTTICPHLGCSVNLNANPSTGFTCPCHAAQYNLDGSRKNQATSVAPRGMDALEWKIEADPGDPNRQLLLVKFQSFKAGAAQKEEVK